MTDLYSCISQSAHVDDTHHSFDRHFYPTARNHVLSVNPRSLKGRCWSYTGETGKKKFYAIEPCYTFVGPYVSPGDTIIDSSFLPTLVFSPPTVYVNWLVSSSNIVFSLQTDATAFGRTKVSTSTQIRPVAGEVAVGRMCPSSDGPACQATAGSERKGEERERESEEGRESQTDRETDRQTDRDWILTFCLPRKVISGRRNTVAYQCTFKTLLGSKTTLESNQKVYFITNTHWEILQLSKIRNKIESGTGVKLL